MATPHNDPLFGTFRVQWCSSCRERSQVALVSRNTSIVTNYTRP